MSRNFDVIVTTPSRVYSAKNTDGVRIIWIFTSRKKSIEFSNDIERYMDFIEVKEHFELSPKDLRQYAKDNILFPFLNPVVKAWVDEELNVSYTIVEEKSLGVVQK